MPCLVNSCLNLYLFPNFQQHKKKKISSKTLALSHCPTHSFTMKMRVPDLRRSVWERMCTSASETWHVVAKDSRYLCGSLRPGATLPFHTATSCPVAASRRCPVASTFDRTTVKSTRLVLPWGRPNGSRPSTWPPDLVQA